MACLSSLTFFHARTPNKNTILVWAYKEFQKGKEGSKGWNDGMIDRGLKQKQKTKNIIFFFTNQLLHLPLTLCLFAYIDDEAFDLTP
jgi:hypothetical protein